SAFTQNGSLSFSKYIPKAALKTTAEKVLSRSNIPNTDFGRMPVPSAPIVMVARQPVAHLLREGSGSFRPPMAMSIRE
ncbi:MAG: hypothetical protein ABS874_09325, partial [Lachnospiraceae bacterium]